MDLTGDFIENDAVAPIAAFGTRWVGHLVKVLQRAIKKLGIYLQDLEDFGKKGKKAKIKSEVFGYASRLQDYQYLLGMGIFLHLSMPLSKLS